MSDEVRADNFLLRACTELGTTKAVKVVIAIATLRRMKRAQTVDMVVGGGPGTVKKGKQKIPTLVEVFLVIVEELLSLWRLSSRFQILELLIFL